MGLPSRRGSGPAPPTPQDPGHTPSTEHGWEQGWARGDRALHPLNCPSRGKEGLAGRAGHVLSSWAGTEVTFSPQGAALPAGAPHLLPDFVGVFLVFHLPLESPDPGLLGAPAGTMSHSWPPPSVPGPTYAPCHVALSYSAPPAQT